MGPMFFTPYVLPSNFVDQANFNQYLDNKLRVVPNELISSSDAFGSMLPSSSTPPPLSNRKSPELAKLENNDLLHALPEETQKSIIDEFNRQLSGRDFLDSLSGNISSGLASIGSSIRDGLSGLFNAPLTTTNISFDGLANSFRGLAETLGTTAAEANAQAQQSAYEAMMFSAGEAQKNRDFQQMIWNQTSAFNAEQAQIDRDWQEYMSNTSYQRAIKDLRAAGLNPILAYHNGGASSGSGASASIGTLSGSQGSGYTASMRSDSSAQELYGDMIKLIVGGITSLIGSGVGALTRLLK